MSVLRGEVNTKSHSTEGGEKYENITCECVGDHGRNARNHYISGRCNKTTVTLGLPINNILMCQEPIEKNRRGH